MLERVFLGSCAFLLAAFAPALDLSLAPIADNLAEPVFVTQVPGDDSRLFIIEKPGRIRIVKNGVLQETPFLDITDEVDDDSSEQGMLGLAFHPNYLFNGYFFVNYTGTSTNPQPPTRIARFQRDGANLDIADPDSKTPLLEIAQPYSNHNGGMIAFGPDGYLYIATGDGGSGNDPDGNGQDRNALLGKLLRIDVDEGGEGAGTGGAEYDVPPGNPFVGVQNVRPEIWAYGLRNPWRFSFDRQTGDLWIGDVGQNAQEEINFQAAASTGGQNYGWVTFEGTRCNTNAVDQEDCDALEPSVTFPVHTYPNPTDGRAVMGGYVYRGNAIPAIQGEYFYSDSNRSFFKTFRLVEGAATAQTDRSADIKQGLSFGAVVSFGEDNAGELYVVDIGGTVYKLVDLDAAEGEGTPEGEGEGGSDGFHAADPNGDGDISLTELLRVIQFFNVGAFSCNASSEDGYAASAGDQTCTAHSSDYNPQDWKIQLSELLRLIQIYNSTGYVACAEGEDGFCPIF